MDKKASDYIRNIVKEVIRETLDNDMTSIFLKRLNQVPFEEQEKLFLNEVYCLFCHDMFSPLFAKRKGILREDNTKVSLPLEKVKQTIMRQYLFNEWQFIIRTFENDVEIAILLPNRDTYIKQLTDDMETMGYFCSSTEDIHYKSLTYKAMRFEPLYQTNVRNSKISDNILFHITPKSNIESIKKNGLIPSSKNEYFHYPDRIYFLLSSNTIADIRKVAKGFYDSNPSKDDYVLLVIDVGKVPQNVEFYDDPMLAKSVYTYDKVPSSAIANIIDLHINI